MSLIVRLIKEIVRNEFLVNEYRKIPTGTFALLHITADLKNAYDAIDNNDIEAMIQAYNTLKNNE